MINLLLVATRGASSNNNIGETSFEVLNSDAGLESPSNIGVTSSFVSRILINEISIVEYCISHLSVHQTLPTQH